MRTVTIKYKREKEKLKKSDSKIVHIIRKVSWFQTEINQSLYLTKF